MSTIKIETEILRDTRLSPVARLIWVLLPNTLNPVHETTFSNIAESVGCSEIEAENAFYELVDNGYLTKYITCRDDEIIISYYEIDYLTIENNIIKIAFKIL